MLRYFSYIGSLITKGSPVQLAVDILKDSLNKKNSIHDNTRHTMEAVEWILRAQNSNEDGGVSEMYSLYRGWHGSYSETTGYIISTMFNYYNISKQEKYRESALEMARWELTKQLESGAFPGGAVGNKEFPIVFNTGQVIFGMVRAFEETNDIRFKQAAEKAANWLVEIQNSNGCWDKSTYLGKIHTYNTRVAWSLLRVHQITNNNAHKEACEKNIDWALNQQHKNGWFEHNTFHEGQEPLLHTIAYSIRGILEAGLYLKNKKYIEQATIPADILIDKIRKDGSLEGSFDKNWKSAVNWSCLTGNSQMAIIWLKLYNETKSKKYLEAAKKANSYNKSTQNVISSNQNIRGAIKGAYPIYGWYAPFCYINWATKFFIDALMLEDDLATKIDS